MTNADNQDSIIGDALSFPVGFKGFVGKVVVSINGSVFNFTVFNQKGSVLRYVSYAQLKNATHTRLILTEKTIYIGPFFISEAKEYLVPKY